ncbi:MAG: hypothetical protein JJ979_25590 [Roseibium sp.]|nr:hypothetical protein [Roseibium sp.]
MSAAQEVYRQRMLLEGFVENAIELLNELDSATEDVEDDADREAILTREGWSG